MIIQQIIQLLKDDEALQALIGSNIYPFSAPMKAIPCLVYVFTPSTDDGIKEQNKLEIRVIANSYASALAIDSACRRVLLTIGDTGISDVLQCSINGGGTLQDANATHIITYYTLINRKVN